MRSPYAVATMSRRKSAQMTDAVSQFFGSAGLDVQIGGTVVRGIRPETVESMSVRGTILHVGDVVRMRSVENGRAGSWSQPSRVLRLIPQGDSARVQIIRADDPDGVFGVPMPDIVAHGIWYREYRVLTQAEIDEWFAEARTLPSGWQPLRFPPEGPRVLVGDGGIPVEIDRRHEGWPVEEVRRLAEIVTGHDVVLETRYADDAKTRRRVRRAARRLAPRQRGET